MVAGRFLNQTDVSGVEKVVVIGNKVKNELFKDQDAVGKRVSIYGINFKVVGVYSDPGGDREESRVFIPLSTAQRSLMPGIPLGHLLTQSRCLRILTRRWRSPLRW